jgi:hypothetical protein
MIDILWPIYKLCLFTIFSFVIFFTIRLLIKRKVRIGLYHLVLFFIFSVFIIGGAGVQNQGYSNLEKFILLENNNELELARQNLENYPTTFQSHLMQFINAEEFRAYLSYHDMRLDKLEAIFVGWLFVLLADLSMLIVKMLRYTAFLLKKI